MPSKPKCEKCNSVFVKFTAICSKCKAGIPLCQSCKSIWKSKRCPRCNTPFAKWQYI